MTDDLDNDKARLELNARAYSYAPTFDALADKIEQGPAAWKDLPAHILGQASVHKDFRDAYRRAVAAGAIPDTRNADTHQEK